MSIGENFVGARMIFADLGVSFCGDNGYSVHGPFKTLIHGVSRILPASPSAGPPLRIALCLYSHADVFAGAARMSAQLSGQGDFSDSSLWLPYFPANISVENARTNLTEEYKRLGRDHRYKVWQNKQTRK